MNHLHPAAAEHERRPHHHRVADARGNLPGLLKAGGHAGFGHRNAHLLHHPAEAVAVLGEVDRVGRRAEDPDAGRGEFIGDVERRLAAELDNNPFRLLLLVDRQHVLDGQRLEVELVGGVVVGGDGLRVAVHHDRLVTGLAQREGGMDAAVVKLDPLTDAVRAAAEHHHLLPGTGRHAVGPVVGRIVIGRVLDAADGQRIPRLDAAELLAPPANFRFGDAEQPAEILVGEAVFLCLDEQVVGQLLSLELEDLLL